MTNKRRIVLGKHLILELTGCRDCGQPEDIKNTLIEAALASNATVIDSRGHEFGDSSGITWVILLAESHISFHSWPEHNYIAIDFFMCGHANPEGAIEVIKEHFKPTNCEITKIDRGYIS